MNSAPRPDTDGGSLRSAEEGRKLREAGAGGWAGPFLPFARPHKWTISPRSPSPQSSPRKRVLLRGTQRKRLSATAKAEKTSLQVAAKLQQPPPPSPASPPCHGHRAMSSAFGKRLWNVALFGAPGGGKGTISNKMLKEFPFLHVREKRYCEALHPSLQTVAPSLHHSDPL